MSPKRERESVLQRNLRVLECFDAVHPFLTLSEITHRCGLPHATTHRIAKELVRERMLERMSDGAYRLGLRLWEFGSRTPGGFGLREIARPHMAAVHSRVRQHTQLGILAGRDALFVERMSTKDAVVNATLIGGRMPLPLTSSGLILLAHASDAIVSDVIAHGWPTPTEQSIRGEGELVERLRGARADGFIVTDGHVHAAARGIAVPVMAPNRRAYAALGVVVPCDDRPSAPIVELLTHAAAILARAIQDSALPDDGDHVSRGFEPLISTSTATLEYFASSAAPDPERRP